MRERTFTFVYASSTTLDEVYFDLEIRPKGSTRNLYVIDTTCGYQHIKTRLPSLSVHFWRGEGALPLWRRYLWEWSKWHLPAWLHQYCTGHYGRKVISDATWKRFSALLLACVWAYFEREICTRNHRLMSHFCSSMGSDVRWVYLSENKTEVNSKVMVYCIES